MTYSMIVGKYKLIFSDTHFKDCRKKPTISVYDADTNSETKIASFTSQETFEWFVEAVVEADRKTEPQQVTGKLQASKTEPIIEVYNGNADKENWQCITIKSVEDKPQTERSE